MSDRKARLAALAAKAGRSKNTAEPEEKPDGDDQPTMEESQQHKPKPSLKFRNYTPADVSLEEMATDSTSRPGEGANKRPRIRNEEEDEKTPQTTTLATTAPSASTAPVASDNKSALERALEKARAEMTPESQVSQAVTSSSSVLAAPMGKHNKKINWDLKRGIQSKLDKLEKRTQKAIVSLLKERLEQDAAETGDGNGDLD